MTSTSLQEQFDAAAAKARSTAVPSNAIKLQIYGLFKQTTEGPMAAAAAAAADKPRPGIFDPAGRAKYDKWKELGNMSKEEAMKQYIALIATL